MGSPDLSAGPLRPRGKGERELGGLAGTGFDSPLGLVSFEAGSPWCERGCAYSVCPFMCLCMRPFCPLIKLQRTPATPPQKKDMDLLEMVVFGRLAVSVSCSGQAALVLEIRFHKSLARASLRHLWSSRAEYWAGPLLPTTSDRAPVDVGSGPCTDSVWEDLEGLCPHVALPCKGRQERNTCPVL